LDELAMKITYEVNFSDHDDAFHNSRTALKNLLLRQNLAVSDLKNDLILENFQSLPNYPGYLTSISHTKGAGAALLAKKESYQSLGIDIEWSDRHLKTEAQRFYRHSEDIYQVSELVLWTMKEAAFKALSPLGFPGVLVLSKIIIQNEKFWTIERPELIGELSIAKLPYEKRELLIAIASVKNN
jgi:phosphopantetheinyl transferase (holo-ACP synthase)